MTEIEKLLECTYDECCNHFINKYGQPKGDYFLDKECRKKNTAITRGKEGLYIHHIDEDKAIQLSQPIYARLNPFDYQKADRLIYCNLLEHLVLHIKIWENPSKFQNKNEAVGVGGVYNFIVPELNDIYSGISYKNSKAKWKEKVIEVVLPLKEDYFKCIKRLVNLGFPHPLLTSYTFNWNFWDPKNNEKIFKELKKLGVKM
ncbi:hypothetical protein [Mycoplasma sp. SG1]|uniref:hypothetical protein n=1 Tax=Mycoplasma sp. SG1 TaxID=2810348 RepID=UPI0020252B49|nr:hypothetical protein [Mycoplasma sp. SG1]URM52983.1 hypothetical protein JRW51_01395 [Mycoplasma sp. SG1]